MRHPNRSPRLVAGLAGVLAVALTACGSPGQGYAPGQTSFVSANPNTGGRSAGGAAGGTPTAGGAGGTANGPSGGTTTPTRTVVEGDVVKNVGSLLYVLNEYRGFQVIDLSNPDHPKRIGMAPIYGHPVEMYIHGTRAYVVVSNYYDYWYVDGPAAMGGGLVDSFRGSQIRVVDISNPSAPAIIGHFDIPGDITDTRIVGDVLYAVSNRYAWYTGAQTNDTKSGTFITSIDVANPQNIQQVDQVSFPYNGYDNHVFVDQNAIYVAQTVYNYNNGYGDYYHTRIKYVDISDPNGKIVLGGQVSEPGMVRDRWMLDATNGVFRMVTAPDWSGRYSPEIYTFQMGAGGTFTPLGHTVLSLPHPESLTAVRFDGPRAYVVTSERIDPLFVIDLSDPANPVQRGSVSMPGWIDHIVPRGNHLVAFGHDEATGNWRLAVSLFDVTDMDHPALLSRVSFGGGWGWVPAKADNYDKVFKVLDNLGLILVPFQSDTQDPNTGVWMDRGGVQLISFDSSSLTLRGLIDADGWVRRALPYKNRILTISDQRMQTVDATDLDHPVVKGSVELARNVDDLVPMGQYGVQLVGDWYEGNTRLVVVPMSNPDLSKPVAEVKVTAPYGNLFVHGHDVYLVDHNWKTSDTEVRVVDLTDPTHPRIAGAVELPDSLSWWDEYGYGWGWYGGDEVTQVGGDKLVFHVWRYWDRGAPGSNGGSIPADADQLLVVDLSNPSRPHVASTMTLSDDDWVWGLHGIGNLLYFSHYRSAGQDAEGRWHVRYYLDRVDLTDAAHPRRLPTVNVPGYVVALSADGNTVYTLDYSWGSDGQEHEAFNTLGIHGSYAALEDRVHLTGWIGNIKIQGPVAYLTTNREWQDAKNTWHTETRLETLSVQDPYDVTVLGQTVLPESWAWLRKVQGKRAFLDLGYLGGMLVYDVSHPATPKLAAFHRHQGWVDAIRVVGDSAYLACGYYGVERVDLGAAQ